ncbi:DNA gyrase subunit A [Allopseudospirillum japonicum]|uniref:DNA gyrase subunit A n=1 Tax=Allopseudospirillum japonicum TaxID=64971 RepID=A0A1H6SB36_9GAMM|nr:DNA gyrase subunit A [Allopseudospirillum japonicum]SEI65223.1 DNA gyrase subunit A [Allopseudospirillum japonicum]
MGEIAREVQTVNIEDELKQSYLDYAMSVIVGRALPDVRDGLKPVHRRVLFAMHELHNDWNKPYKKSARVVGDVIGKYHPHGDSAVYDTIVRMAQTFAMRYVLVDGQGNFGSIDGDAAAAMRYTEVRMAKLAHEMLADLEKETVDFVENYDGTELIPDVLPTRLPNLLINGSSGIAVGMATNIPPHNLGEVVQACLALLEDPDLDTEHLMEYIPGPDFPTGALINGRAGILDAYRTGRGRIYVRAKHEVLVDERTGRETILITELPYQVNKARLIEKIADLVKEKRLEGISELRDESDKDGLRVVIELKRGESGEVVVNNLFSQTPLQISFGINIVALEDGQPKVLNLKQLLEAFIRHRREVVTRRTLFELKKSRERGHVLEGLAVALSNVDEVVRVIRACPSAQEARAQLQASCWNSDTLMQMLNQAGHQLIEDESLPVAPSAQGYVLSETQAQAILDLRLHRLTGLEQDKLLGEYKEVLDKICYLQGILADDTRLLTVICTELQSILDEYADPRRTQILFNHQDLSREDLITPEEVVLTLSRGGYAKTQPLDAYQAQKRGGRGKTASALKDEDVIEHLLVANTHDTVMLFSNLGRLYWLKVYEIPQAGRTSRGRPLVNLLPLSKDEWITAVLPLSSYEAHQYVCMATAAGVVKKTELRHFSRPRTGGIIALNLDEGDRLVGVALTSGEQDIALCTNTGKMIRFPEEALRALGRSARGVKGINLTKGAQVISLMILPSETQQTQEDTNIYILTASESGYGKRTLINEFSAQGRGGMGVIAMRTSERNGALVAASLVHDQDELMLITDKGTLVRTRVAEISISSRNTQGVTLIRLAEEERLVSAVRIQELSETSLNEDEALLVAETEATSEEVADTEVTSVV